MTFDEKVEEICDDLSEYLLIFRENSQDRRSSPHMVLDFLKEFQDSVKDEFSNLKQYLEKTNWKEVMNDE